MHSQILPSLPFLSGSSSAEHYRHLQLEKLRHYLTHRVLPFSEHYRHLDVDPRSLRSLEDLSQIPFTSKRDLHDRAREFLLLPEEEVLRRQPSTIFKALTRGRKGAQKALEAEFRPLLMTSTTGRSSDPVPFLYTAYDLENLNRTGRMIMEVGESKPEYKHANLFPYAPHLAYWQAYHAGIAYGTFMLGTGGGKVMGTEGNLRMLDKVKPEVVIAMPTFLYHLLHAAVESDLQWKQLKMLVLGGEKVPPGMRRKLRGLCAELGAGRVDVLSTYGFTEAKAAWNECPAPKGAEPSGYHLHGDLGLVEVVDPKTGDQVPDGHPGEIVYTPLDARGSVVLRYRTGDYISKGITYEPCPYCARTCPRLVGEISRASEFRSLDIHKVKGTLVNFNALEHEMDDEDEIRAWQVEIRKRHDDPYECDELHLLVTPKPGRERAELERLLRRRFRKATETTPNVIEFYSMEEMRDRLGVGRLLKEEKIVDCRPSVKSETDKESSPSRAAVGSSGKSS